MVLRPAWAMQFFAPTLGVLERAFRLLEARVPPRDEAAKLEARMKSA